MPVLRPLIEKDKEEIIKMAKRIKAFKISQKPQEDCCSLFVPKKATAKGDLKRVEELEKKIKSVSLEKRLTKKAKAVIFPLNRV